MEFCGDVRVIDLDLLLDDAIVPDGMQVGFGAWPIDRDKVAASVIVKGHVQRLVHITDPMPKAFEKSKLVAHIETEGKVPRVVQDGGNDTTIGNRTGMCSVDPLRRARQVYIMLG